LNVQNKYDNSGKLRFTQDANQANAGLVGFARYDTLGRAINGGEAAAGFDTLSGNQTYAFESDNLNQVQATAYDEKPNTGIFPWSLFASQISGTALNHTHGAVVAEAFKTTGKSGAGQALENQTVTDSLTLATAGILTVGPSYTIESSGNVTLQSGSEITLKPGFHAKAGSKFNASIDPGLDGSGDNDSDWQLTLYSYNERGRPATKYIFTQDQPDIDTRIDYTYNYRGDLVKQQVQVGSSQHFYHFYEYDNLGQLARVYTNTTDSKPGTPDVTYTYNESGQVVSEDISGQAKADCSYSYDLKGHLEHIENGDNTFSEDLTYNNSGTIASAAYTNGGISYSYNYYYDDFGRLDSALYSNGTDAFDVKGITYDKHGNIKTLRRYANPGLVDNLTYTLQMGTNKLQSVADAVAQTSEDWDAEDATFSYDGNGNMKTNTGKGVENIGYDTRNLPVGMRLNNNLQAMDGQSHLFLERPLASRTHLIPQIT